jgi:hypothetical protein
VPLFQDPKSPPPKRPLLWPTTKKNFNEEMEIKQLSINEKKKQSIHEEESNILSRNNFGEFSLRDPQSPPLDSCHNIAVAP